MASPSTFKRIAIFGPGLLGGSVAMALREMAPETRVRVWGRRVEAVRTVADRGLAELASTSVAEVASEADLAILCLPVEHMAALAAELAVHLRPEAIVTDVGSVKRVVMDEVAPLVRERAHFVGSHPMAGSEQAGFEAARGDLFQGAICIVTSEPEKREPEVLAVEEFWKCLGCQVRRMTPDEHDARVAWISHLPHLLAAGLVNAVQENAPEALELCGNGFRDTTRVAAGPAEMWTEIFRHNREALRDSAEAMIEKLREFATLLDGFDEAGVRARLSAARDVRDRLKKT